MALIDSVSKTPDEPLWQGEDKLRFDETDGEIRGWLTHDGLLTRRMRSTCGESFRLELLRFEPCSLETPDVTLLEDARRGMVRDIRLCCEGRARVFARTVIPEVTLERHPWLRKLGQSALGETLSSRPSVRRSPFEYAALHAGQRLFDAALDNTDVDASMLWARRSRFFIGDDVLLVYEIFLPVTADSERC